MSCPLPSKESSKDVNQQQWDTRALSSSLPALAGLCLCFLPDQLEAKRGNGTHSSARVGKPSLELKSKPDAVFPESAFSSGDGDLHSKLTLCGIPKACPGLRREKASCIKEVKVAQSCSTLFEIPWTMAYQAPLSVGFSRQEYRRQLPFPSPGDLPDPGIEPVSLTSPALAGVLPGNH